MWGCYPCGAHSMIAQNMQGVAVLIEFAKGTNLLKKIYLPNFVSDEHYIQLLVIHFLWTYARQRIGCVIVW